ncbi:hypothetical protein BKA65DRAFT_510930 [Rhexocercosporidium sp. MPI-PUGE-AT-0058]|nr:hypothetical protein BKA65DRAFT_510930 [Rhexocercosporidium sp. MPI-PUGE-AT-0058]
MDPPIQTSPQYLGYEMLAHDAPRGLVDKEEVRILEFVKELPCIGWQTLESVDDLKTRDPCDFRIISAPLDIPSQENEHTHLEIFRHYKFPVGFLTERLRSVGHSFGSCTRPSTQYSWFHFLCKNITLDTNGKLEIRNPNIISLKQLSQADFSWLRSGFMLCSQSKPGSQEKEVTLICFGAHSWIERPFHKDLQWKELMHDPMALFYIIFEELYLQLDTATRKLGDVFGIMESNVLDQATIGSIAGRMDFAGLHNVSKHITHLREGVDAAILTLKSVVRHSDRSDKSTHPTLGRQTLDLLEHCQTLFQSTKLRLVSLESRMANVINLSFHLVTQQDSKSMKTIAFLTLFFLPASTVASIFGSQFFNLSIDQDGTSHFIFTHWFWIMWVIVVPITGILVAIWRWPEAMAASHAKQGTGGHWNALWRLYQVG